MKYYDYSEATLSSANRFLDNVKYIFHPLVLSRITEKLGYSNTLGSKLFVPSNSIQIYISCYYTLGKHTSLMQYEKQIINGEVNL